MTVRELTIADFETRRGQPFTVEAAGRHFALALAEAEALPHSARGGGAFRLEFRGPPDPILPQATYRFDLGGEWTEIFIVPIGRTAEATLYEAIFF